MYSSTLSLTSPADGVGCQRKTPASLAPVKTWCPLNMRPGGFQDWSVRAWKFSPPPGFQLQTVQPVASRYTDSAIPGQSQSSRCGLLYQLLGSIRRMSFELVSNPHTLLYLVFCTASTFTGMPTHICHLSLLQCRQPRTEDQRRRHIPSTVQVQA